MIPLNGQKERSESACTQAGILQEHAYIHEYQRRSGSLSKMLSYRRTCVVGSGATAMAFLFHAQAVRLVSLPIQVQTNYSPASSETGPPTVNNILLRMVRGKPMGRVYYDSKEPFWASAEEGFILGPPRSGLWNHQSDFGTCVLQCHHYMPGVA